MYLKSFGQYSISCTGFIRVMESKSLLLDINTATALLFCKRGVGWGGGVIGGRRKMLDIVGRGGRIESIGTK